MSFKNSLKLLPVIGLLFIIIGYIYIIIEINKCKEEVVNLEKEAADLEKRKAYLKQEVNLLENQANDYKNIILQTNDSVAKEKINIVEVKKKESLELIKSNTSIVLKQENNYQLATTWEKKGFEYLLDKDIANAIEAFHKSENSYNSFHQVYEIGNYLEKNRSKLVDKSSNNWKDVYKEVALNYNWKMSSEVKNKLLNASK